MSNKKILEVRKEPDRMGCERKPSSAGALPGGACESQGYFGQRAQIHTRQVGMDGDSFGARAMNSQLRISGLHTYQLLLYRKALHPELFQVKARRQIQHSAYELESWLMPGGHLMRFRHNGFTACELMVGGQEGQLPLEGAVTAFPVAGEHDFEHQFKQEKVTYVTSVQTETLPENLYASTYEEMVDFAKETGALVHKWSDAEEMHNLSLLDVQRLGREVHAQSYHLLAQGGVVIRSQTIFEHK